MFNIQLGDYVEARGIANDEEFETAGYVTKILRGRLYLTTKQGVLDCCLDSQVQRLKPFAEVKASGEFAFEVPEHNLMYLKKPGKLPGTVLTLEQQFYSVRLCEYVDPLFYDRAWCFATLAEAIPAMQKFVNGDLEEPEGWKRAISVDEGIRRRTATGEIVRDETF